ncbi:MAG: dTDP-4-dehydrorhamnose 3,5-epimerase [Bacteroidetes bacterium]|nr:dTDP-4-dehydrorhamnose 3,5-epimerase [Bacteroidota bacterium]
MKFVETGFKGLIEIYPAIFEDSRGGFFESWSENVFSANGINYTFQQDNQSVSAKNVLRGLHLQIPPFEQGKLVRVAFGRVLDVVVDIRKSQPTYGKYFKIELSADKNNMLWIPPGFAHGFLTLEDNTIFLYKCTKVYNKESERSIIWNDPNLNIDWGCDNPIISEKDKQAVLFKEFETPFN